MPDCQSSDNRSIWVEYPEPDVAHIVMDQFGKSANVISRAFQQELESAIDEIESRGGLNVVILSSAKPKIFVAGADLNAIADTLDWSDAQIIGFCDYGRRLYHRLQQGPWTSVAAISGACVGGGLELALGCDWRIASDDRRTLFGLPETKLGLIPGWAGTVRLPRMMPLEKAIGLIASAELFPATQAVELGLVDRVVPTGELISTAIALARDPKIISQRDDRRQKQLGRSLTEVADIEVMEKDWRDRIQSFSNIHPFAAEVLASHMIRSAGMNFEAACQSEARAMAVVYGCPSSHGLLNNFFLGEHNRRSPGWEMEAAESRSVNRLGIVGCGVMGKSIAHLATSRKMPVSLFDSKTEIAEKLVSELPAELCHRAKKISELADCDLIIEAVAENLMVKQVVLEEVVEHVPDDSLVATNTSTIPVGELAKSVTHPERFCGIHFCHPQLMELVEIVIGQESSANSIQSAREFVRKLGKTAVVVRDGPGFVVNRLLMAMIEEAVALASEGNPWPEIDRALREFGMIGGPFEIIDQIGIDTVVGAGKSMAMHGVKSRRNSPILPRMVRHGRLGVKTGSGFYNYSLPGTNPIDKKSESLLADYMEKPGVIDETEIVDRILLALLNAATRILDSGIVADPRDIDICLIRGLGFPSHIGGILFWADQSGPDRIAGLLKKYNDPQIEISESLDRWLRSSDYFYAHGSRTSRDQSFSHAGPNQN